MSITGCPGTTDDPPADGGEASEDNTETVSRFPPTRPITAHVADDDAKISLTDSILSS